MGPIQQAITDGTIHPKFHKDNLKVVELTNLYDPKEKVWVVAQAGRNKLQPIGDEQGMFRYETEEEAREERDALNLWQMEALNND